MSAVDLLRRSPLFARFDKETLARVAERFNEVEVPTNQVLIEPRMPGAGLFVICEGTAVVEAPNFERELGPGEIVGEVSLLEDDGMRSARVIAKTPLRCLALARPDFEQLLGELPELEDAVRDLARARLAELKGET